MEELRCIGCGSILQSQDQKAPGYVPAHKLEEEDVTCRRCFKLQHYNEVIPMHLSKDHYRDIISTIGMEDALVVMIIDIFDIEGSMIPQIRKLTNDNDMLLIANKIDLLPKSVKQGKLVHHLKKIASDYLLKPLDVLLMSAIKNKNLDDVMDQIEDYAKGRKVYIVGATNVGKSTFINALLKSYGGSDKDIITVSNNAGTTLDMITIPFGDSFIIDTPGIINDNQLTHYISPKALKQILPKKEIKPMVFQLDQDQTLFFGGLSRVDYIQGDKTSFVCYCSNELHIHRTKLEKADSLYQTQLGKILSPPFETDDALDLKKHVLQVHSKDKVDIVIPGLGFIAYKGPGLLHVYCDKHITPYIREALI
jgi:ribosome biogenesis GTPase YqeH